MPCPPQKLWFIFRRIYIVTACGPLVAIFIIIFLLLQLPKKRDNRDYCPGPISMHGHDCRPHVEKANKSAIPMKWCINLWRWEHTKVVSLSFPRLQYVTYRIRHVPLVDPRQLHASSPAVAKDALTKKKKESGMWATNVICWTCARCDDAMRYRPTCIRPIMYHVSYTAKNKMYNSVPTEILLDRWSINSAEIFEWIYIFHVCEFIRVVIFKGAHR